MRRPVPPPIKTAVTDAQGYSTIAWAMFFQSLYKPIHANTLANKPVNLRSQDEGLLFRATDFDRWFRWNGSAWERAPWERITGEVVWTTVAPGTGWTLCDGNTTRVRTNADATTTTLDGATADKTLPNLVGRYPKGGAAYTGANVAAVAPGLAGSTLPATTGVTTDAAGGGGAAQSGAGAATTGSHSHGVTDPGHSHGVGTLAVDATAEPAHVVLLPYYRL